MNDHPPQATIREWLVEAMRAELRFRDEVRAQRAARGLVPLVEPTHLLEPDEAARMIELETFEWRQARAAARLAAGELAAAASSASAAIVSVD